MDFRELGEEVAAQIKMLEDAAEAQEGSGHISEHDLERYHLGVITSEEELAAVEEHLLWCAACVDRAELTDHTVDVIRAAIATARNGADPE